MYNLLLSLLQFSDDVSGAFRWPRLHPWIATAFSFLLFEMLYIPTGQVFGSITSAQNFESISKFRTILARHIFEHENCDDLIHKYYYLIDQVKFSQDNTPDTAQFTQVKSCPQHKGIRRSNGSLDTQPFIMFVDDNLMAGTPDRIKQCMAANLEALFCTMGYDAPTIQRSNVSIE